MGNPSIYWYPEAGAPLDVITLSRRLSDLQETKTRARVTSKAGDGSASVVTGAASRRIRIVLERGITSAEVRKLEALRDHLQRGGAIGFSRDHDKSWAGYGSKLSIGYTYASVGYPYNHFSAWSGAAALASGDEVVLETPNPEWRSSMHAITGVSGGVVSLSSSTVPWTAYPFMARWRDFYPALRLPDDQSDKPIVYHEHRIAWSLDMELEMCPEILMAGFYGRPTTMFGWQDSASPMSSLGLGSTTSPIRGTHTTLDQLLQPFNSGASLQNALDALGRRRV